MDQATTAPPAHLPASTAALPAPSLDSASKPTRTALKDGVASAEINEDADESQLTSAATNPILTGAHGNDDAPASAGSEREEGEITEGAGGDKENVVPVAEGTVKDEIVTKDGPSPSIIPSDSPSPAPQTPLESTAVSTVTPGSTPNSTATPVTPNPAPSPRQNKQRAKGAAEGDVKSSSCLSVFFSCFSSSAVSKNYSDDKQGTSTAPTEKKKSTKKLISFNNNNNNKSSPPNNGLSKPSVNPGDPKPDNGIPLAPLVPLPVPSSDPLPTPTPTPTHIPHVPSSTLAAATVAASLSAGVVLSQEETEGVTSGAVVPPGKGPGRRPKRNGPGGKQVVDQNIITSVPEPGRPMMKANEREKEEQGSTESESGEESGEEDEESDEEQSLIARGGVGIPIGEDGLPHPLLDEISSELKGRKCLVLDLDETLVHSSFKQMVHQADYVVPVEIENQYHNVYVIKRPGVDAFLKAMGEIYEVVIFTASLSKYADPVLDQLDIHRVVKHRLFRESCYNNKGNYVKDLSQLGRPMSDCIIIDNSPASYVFHPNNAVPISSWFNDPHDTELTDLVPFLTDLEQVDDVRGVLDAGLYQTLSGQLQLEEETTTTTATTVVAVEESKGKGKEPAGAL